MVAVTILSICACHPRARAMLNSVVVVVSDRRALARLLGTARPVGAAISIAYNYGLGISREPQRLAYAPSWPCTRQDRIPASPGPLPRSSGSGAAVQSSWMPLHSGALAAAANAPSIGKRGLGGSNNRGAAALRRIGVVPSVLGAPPVVAHHLLAGRHHEPHRMGAQTSTPWKVFSYRQPSLH